MATTSTLTRLHGQDNPYHNQNRAVRIVDMHMRNNDDLNLKLLPILQQLNHTSSKWHGPSWRLADAVETLVYRARFPSKEHVTMEEESFTWMLYRYHGQPHMQKFPFSMAVNAYVLERKRLFGELTTLMLPIRPTEPCRKRQNALINLENNANRFRAETYLPDMLTVLLHTHPKAEYAIRSLGATAYFMGTLKFRPHHVPTQKRVETGLDHFCKIYSTSSWLEFTPLLTAFHLLQWRYQQLTRRTFLTSRYGF